MTEPDQSKEELAAAQEREYGTYVANGPIYFDGALAYAEGHPVPVSNVEKHKYVESGQVRKVGEDAPAAVEQPKPKRGADVVLNEKD